MSINPKILLSESIQEVKVKPVCELVIDAVTEYLGIPADYFLVNVSTDYESAFKRWLLYYFMKEHTLLSNEQIVALIKKRSHNQVSYGVQKIQDKLSIRDKYTVKTVAHIQELIEVKINKQKQWLIHSNS